MRSIDAVGLVIVACGLLASACDRPESGKPASPASPGSPPASQPTSQLADKSDPDVVQWRSHCDLDDGRRFLTDGSLLLESRYLPTVPVPDKSVPAPAAQRLLQSETDHEFALDDLHPKTAGGHYVAPGGMQLNRKYIDVLRGSPLKATLRFRARGPKDPVLIPDDQKVVGVMMP